jgi:hypothetical protein
LGLVSEFEVLASSLFSPRGKNLLGFFSVAEVAASQKVYLLQSFVAGFRFYKGMELLPLMQEQDIVELRRQPDNEHDEFAVAVYWQQQMIGYLRLLPTK